MIETFNLKDEKITIEKNENFIRIERITKFGSYIEEIAYKNDEKFYNLLNEKANEILKNKSYLKG